MKKKKEEEEEEEEEEEKRKKNKITHNLQRRRKRIKTDRFHWVLYSQLLEGEGELSVIDKLYRHTARVVGSEGDNIG